MTFPLDQGKWGSEVTLMGIIDGHFVTSPICHVKTASAVAGAMLTYHREAIHTLVKWRGHQHPHCLLLLPDKINTQSNHGNGDPHLPLLPPPHTPLRPQAKNSLPSSHPSSSPPGPAASQGQLENVMVWRRGMEGCGKNAHFITSMPGMLEYISLAM